MFKKSKILYIFLFAFISINTLAQIEDTSVDLLSQIESLQTQTGIQIEGLDKIQNDVKAKTYGNSEQQIKQLFAAYNHIAIRNKKGNIERIVILNKKPPKKESRIVLPTKRQGSHFTVEVAVSGDGRLWQDAVMVLDTGADLVVLPESMIESIGLAGSRFTEAKMQTANGEATAKIGLLKELKIAGETIENVEVAFVADALLGENKLLGMSVLGRFQFDIDDKNQLITLTKKPAVFPEP
jgi:aspartyl protease family protein